jgi:hypothetical protein
MKKKLLIFIALIFLSVLQLKMWGQPPEKETYPLRTFLEISGLLGIGFMDYMVKYSSDSEYSTFWEGFKEKISGNGIRLDEDGGQTNIGHALAGDFYYSVARSNNYSFWGSSLITLSSTLVWELGFEHLEIFSINDIIVTSVGGIGAGEPLYRTSSYLLKNTSGFFPHFFAFLLSPPTAIHYAIDSPPSGNSEVPEEDPSFLLDFEMGYARLNMDEIKNKNLLLLGFHNELFTIHSFSEPGKKSHFYSEPIYSEIDFCLTTSLSGLEMLWGRTKVTYLGYYFKDISEAGEGYEWILGAETGILGEKTVEFYRDWLFRIDVAGIQHLFRYYSGEFILENQILAAGTFALMKPLAAEKYTKLYPSTGPSLFASHLYYYFYGLSLETTLDFQYRWFRAGGRAGYNFLHSIRESHNLWIDDEEFNFSLFTGFEFIENFLIEVSFHHTLKTSKIDSVRVEVHGNRYEIKSVFRF